MIKKLAYEVDNQMVGVVYEHDDCDKSWIRNSFKSEEDEDMYILNGNILIQIGDDEFAVSRRHAMALANILFAAGFYPLSGDYEQAQQYRSACRLLKALERIEKASRSMIGNSWERNDESRFRSSRQALIIATTEAEEEIKQAKQELFPVKFEAEAKNEEVRNG